MANLDHEAIYKAYPSVVSIDDAGSKILDASGNAVSVEQSNIDSARTTLNSESAAIAYQSTRQSLYCLLYTSPSPRDRTRSRMPSSA